MPTQESEDRYVRVAVLIMLWLTLFASVSATLIHWLGPVHHMMDLIVPPSGAVIFAGLIIALMLRPWWLQAIVHVSLALGALMLIAPAWFYTLQAASTGVRLIDVLPPVASLFVILLTMVMIFVPGRRAFLVALLCWLVIALPILTYLAFHPGEMWTPRGMDLLMAYGPVSIMVVVLLPVQRGLTDTIKRMASERARMETMLHRDPVTGIYNRRLGERVLRDLLNGTRPAGLIMLDLDHFKAVNDTHGHPVGDLVLQAVAGRCKSLLRPDECISRWGGEEFLVLVPGIDTATLHMVAERLQLAIAQLSVAPVPQVTASFGATMLDSADNFDTALQRVDRALYAAKKQGGNRVVLAGATPAVFARQFAGVHDMLDSVQ
ncbi:MAG: GGDEF domain-containing protein [Castellaniella sp.]|uniref:GGDEF domain-containing protein n=1 Tax=Castellaniella sp. TaxID=1955812 RepID=UPI00120A47E8|nr:GGDEF domain-containing protein [Castellaniella sp.]TAN29892.1 MAG: GGDEF domain-containing protein [Castellaniella sp.]